ncbi:hypothetical protein C8Q79DRAFT_1005665 [Trametes meyenii]|nr:hypothetical protein C8Q79DRAFT_1005665 [Trametes meyenii]
MSTVDTDPTPLSRKHARSDANWTSECPTKDDEFWFEDGNVVLVLESSAFRVHRGVLSRHSETFRNLFSIPQPKDVDDIETLDECPVVRLQDSLHDFKHLLQAFYDGMTAQIPAEASARFSVLAALLRLSHKYEIEHIMEATSALLKPMFPNDLPSLLKRCTLGRSHTVKFAPGQEIEAVNLFRQCERPEMLLVALYWCTGLDIHVLLHGYTRADGSIEHLSTSDLERCFVAREKLERRSAKFNREQLDSGDSRRPTCRGTAKCNSALRSLWTCAEVAMREAQLPDSESSMRLYFAKAIGDPTSLLMFGLCRECVHYVKGMNAVFDEQLWRDLPGILDLEVPNWLPVINVDPDAQ